MKKIFLILFFAGVAGAFSVEAAPQPPTRLSPCGDTTVTSLVPKLSWDAVQGQGGGVLGLGARSKIGYKWEVFKKNGDFVDGRLEAQGDNWAIIKPGALNPDNDYTWHVKSTDITGTSGESAWSNQCAFNTNKLQAPAPPSGDEPVIFSVDPEKGPLGTVITITGSNFACATYANKKNAVIFTDDNNQTFRNESPRCLDLYNLVTAIPKFPETSKTIAIQVQVGDAASNLKSFSVKAAPLGGDTTGADRQYNLIVAWPPTPLGTAMPTDNLPELIKYLYEWGISLAGFAAFIVLVIAGFQYLTSAGNPGKMQEAMDRIKSAGLGIVLLFGSILVLNTINPQLTQLKIPPIDKDGAGVGKIEIKNTFKPCKDATVFSKVGGNISFVASDSGVPKPFKNPSSRVDSVVIEGLCQVKLCQNGCGDEADPPVISVFYTTNIADMGKGVELMTFTSAELIDLYKTLNLKAPTQLP